MILGALMSLLNHTSDHYVDHDAWTFVDIDGEEFVYDEYLECYYESTKNNDQEYIDLMKFVSDKSVIEKIKEPENFRSIDEPWFPYDN